MIISLVLFYKEGKVHMPKPNHDWPVTLPEAVERLIIELPR